jgi:hypothetical protein
MKAFVRAALGASSLLFASALAWPTAFNPIASVRAQTADVAVEGGRWLGATRFQLAWLDWNAPRPVFVTALTTPSVAHDVAALAGVNSALLSVSSPGDASRTWGADPSAIYSVDLSTAPGQRIQSTALIPRSDPDESLSWPAYWPDGSAFLFTLVTPATAYAHGTLADVWIVNTDGSNLHQLSTLRVHDPALPWSPDGSQLFAYGEWGGVLIDMASGEDTLVTYLTGTTAVAWLP